MKTIKTTARHNKVRRIGLYLMIASFGLLGFYFLSSGSAATYTATSQAESATLGGKASRVSNATASGASAIQFGGSTMNGWTDADLFIEPNSNAAKQAVTWASSNPAGAARMRKMAAGATTEWVGDWYGSKANVQNAVNGYFGRVLAQGANKIGLITMYAIPGRDCGSYSGGGYTTQSAYNAYVEGVSAGIGSRKAIVIVEPDALPQLTTCLSASQQTQRLQMLSYAVSTIKTNNPNTKVYLDAGNSGWIDATTIANRLNGAGIAKADGFATNVSNFKTTSAEITYGTSVSGKVGGKHFVIDTSRNGNGPGSTWCNPSGRALGKQATFTTNNSLVDMFIWIKRPGQSDGTCNGGPSAGTWWPSYADGLAINAGY